MCATTIMDLDDTNEYRRQYLNNLVIKMNWTNVRRFANYYYFSLFLFNEY
jgi:hypothetical protein